MPTLIAPDGTRVVATPAGAEVLRDRGYVADEHDAGVRGGTKTNERPGERAPKAEWASYAALLGIEVTAEMTLRDIVAAVDEHDAGAGGA